MVKTELGVWKPLGGHDLWTAPEAMPRSYSPDNDPVAFTIEGSTIRLVQPVESKTGIEKALAVTLDETGSAVTVLRLSNRNVWDIGSEQTLSSRNRRRSESATHKGGAALATMARTVRQGGYEMRQSLTIIRRALEARRQPHWLSLLRARELQRTRFETVWLSALGMTWIGRLTKADLATDSMFPAKVPYRRQSSPSWIPVTLRMPYASRFRWAATATHRQPSQEASPTRSMGMSRKQSFGLFESGCLRSFSR